MPGSTKKKVSKKQGTKVQSSKLTGLDTFGTWLDNQKGHELEKGTFRSTTEGKMPANTTQDWLAKQDVIDSVEAIEVEMPTGTTETWLRKQVSQRISVEEPVKEAPPQA